MSCGNRAELSGKSGRNGKCGTDLRGTPAAEKGAEFSRKGKKSVGGRKNYVMYYFAAAFCRSGKKEVDGGGKACYTIIQCLTTIMPLDLLRAAIAFRPTGVVN